MEVYVSSREVLTHSWSKTIGVGRTEVGKMNSPILRVSPFSKSGTPQGHERYSYPVISPKRGK